MMKSDALYLRMAIILCGFIFLLSSCSVREDLFFDDPAPEMELSGPLYKAAKGGSTLYYGNARNVGGMDAENVVIFITVFGPGDASLGTYSASVGLGYDDSVVEVVDEVEVVVEEGGVVDDIPSGEIGSFILLVPVHIGQIVRETVVFSFTAPTEEE